MIEVKEVLRLWLAGVAKKRIATQLGLDPKTVHRYVKSAVNAGIQSEATLTDERLAVLMSALHANPGRAHGDTWGACQVHREFIERLLKQRVRLSKIRRLLERRGVRVPYPTLHRYAVVELGFGRTAVAAHAHVTIVGPVGVGKTFLAHALGHIACRRGAAVLAVRADQMLKTLQHARLDHTYEAELRKLITVELLVVDDFGLDAMDPIESRDAYEIFTERHRVGSMIVTSNRGPDEWLATYADPMRAQSAIDRFTSNSYDLVIDGESYRRRQKPRLQAGQLQKA